MKKWIVFLLIAIMICFCGCSKDVEMSSLSEYEMVSTENKNCGDTI